MRNGQDHVVSIPSSLHIITRCSESNCFDHLFLDSGTLCGNEIIQKNCPNISKPFLHHDIIQPSILQYPFPPKSQAQDTKVSEVAPKKGMLVTYADMSLQAEPQKNSIDVWILCHILSPKRKNPTRSGKQMAPLSCISFPYFCILHSAFP